MFCITTPTNSNIQHCAISSPITIQIFTLHIIFAITFCGSSLKTLYIFLYIKFTENPRISADLPPNNEEEYFETLKLFLLMDTILFYIPKPHKWRIYLVVTPCCWGAVRECEIYFFLFLSLVELVVVLEVRIVVTKIVGMTLILIVLVLFSISHSPTIVTST